MADLTDFDTPSFLLMEDAGFTLMEDWQPGWYIDGEVAAAGGVLIHPGMNGGLNRPQLRGGLNG